MQKKKINKKRLVQISIITAIIALLAGTNPFVIKTFAVRQSEYSSCDGIENIFRFFRVDAIHRLTYLNYTEDITKFGINLIGIPWELGQGSDTGKPYIKRIHVYSKNITVNNFRFVSQDGYYVIKIESGDNCRITNNTIYGNPNYYQGIFATKSKNFIIERFW